MSVVFSAAEALNLAWGLIGDQTRSTIADRLEDTTFRRQVVRSAQRTLNTSGRPQAKALGHLLEDRGFLAFAIAPEHQPYVPPDRDAFELAFGSTGSSASDAAVALAHALTLATFALATPVERAMIANLEDQTEILLHLLNIGLDLHDRADPGLPSPGTARRLRLDLARMYPNPEPDPLRDAAIEFARALLRPWESGRLDTRTSTASWAIAAFARLVHLSSVDVHGSRVEVGIDTDTYDSTVVNLVEVGRSRARLSVPLLTDWDFAVLRDAVGSDGRPNPASILSKVKLAGGAELIESWSSWFTQCDCPLNHLSQMTSDTSMYASFVTESCPVHLNLIAIMGSNASYWGYWVYALVDECNSIESPPV